MERLQAARLQQVIRCLVAALEHVEQARHTMEIVAYLATEADRRLQQVIRWLVARLEQAKDSMDIVPAAYIATVAPRVVSWVCSAPVSVVPSL